MNKSILLAVLLLSTSVMGSGLAAAASPQDVMGAVVTEDEDVILKECRVVCLADARALKPKIVYETKTDSLGQFRLPAGTPPYQAVVAQKKDYGPGWLLLNGAPQEPLKIVLSRAGSLKGRILDDADKAMNGVTVTAQLAETPRAIAQLLIVQTKANNLGEFQLDGLAGRQHLLQIQSPTHLLPEGRPVTVSSGETAGPLEFKAVRAFSITGRVLDIESGNPIAGALVWASAGPGAEQTKTDAAGGYRLNRLAPGWHVLHVGAMDLNYVSVEAGASENVGYPGTLQILVRDKNLEDMHVRLRLGCEIIGLIIDKEKNPLQGYIVHLNNNEPQLSTLVRRRRVVSDEKGRFICRGVPAGDKYYCRINQPGKEGEEETVQFSTELFNVDRESSPKRLTITVEPPPQLSR